MLDIQRADRAVPPFVRKARRQGWGNEDLGGWAACTRSWWVRPVWG